MSGTGQEVATVLQDVAGQAGPALAEDFAGAHKGILHETADGLEGDAGRIVESEANVTCDLAAIGGSGGEQALAGAEQDAGRLAGAEGREEPSLGGEGGGQVSEGNANTETGQTDPVDVVSGQMPASDTDLGLPGVLPLVLRRAYASGYPGGALFGPG